jgi:hypothetical protein
MNEGRNTDPSLDRFDSPFFVARSWLVKPPTLALSDSMVAR